MTNEQETQNFHKAMGLVLQSARTGAGLSPQKLAENSGITEIALMGYERGEIAIDVHTLHHLAQCLGIPAPALLESAIKLFHEQQDTASHADDETREAGELIRRFLHVEGPSRGEKFMHLVNELKKDS